MCDTAAIAKMRITGYLKLLQERTKRERGQRFRASSPRLEA